MLAISKPTQKAATQSSSRLMEFKLITSSHKELEGEEETSTMNSTKPAEEYTKSVSLSLDELLEKPNISLSIKFQSTFTVLCFKALNHQLLN